MKSLQPFLLLLFTLCLSSVLSSCYTFTGASVPPHLKTLQIPLAEDVSGFGDARYRDILTLRLAQVFRTDNTFTIVQDKSDALLNVTITSITDATATVSNAGVTGTSSADAAGLERERKVTVAVEVTYSDLVKKKKFFEKKSFSQFRVYQVSEGQQGRDAAIQRVLQLVSDDILLAVISGW